MKAANVIEALPTLPAAQVEAAVQAWLQEDIGSGDVTADLVPAEHIGQATLVVREPAVLCGGPWVEALFALVSADVQIEWCYEEGSWLPQEAVFARLTGPTRALLTGERTALNILQTLSGTATVTRQWSAALGEEAPALLDTRKTLPGLRLAQKYAVKCGGGQNHRMGLYDAYLIKENHILACGSITAAVAKARATRPELWLQVEVETLAELEEALAASVDCVLLDNFSLSDIEAAVHLTAGRVPLEVSGNVAADVLPQLAATGVDRISMGALTKHVKAIDISMRLV